MIQYLPCITGDVKLANSSSTTQKFLADMPTTLQNLVTVSANPVPPHILQKPTSSDATLTPCNPTDPNTVIPITENHSTGANPAAILVPQSSSIVQPATVIAQVIDPIEISLPCTEPATGTATPVASPIESSPQPQLPDAKPEIISTIATKEEIEEFLALDKDLFEKLQQEMYDYEDKMWHAKLAGCKPTDPVTATPVTVNHSTGVDPTVVLDFQSSSNAQPATDIPVTENHSTSVNSATALVPQSSSTVQPTTVIAQVIETSTEPATGTAIPITSPIKSSPQPQLPDAAPENTPVTEEELEGFLAAYDRVSFDKILQELFDYVDKTDQSGVASCSQAPRSNADATLTPCNPTDPITVIPVTENHPSSTHNVPSPADVHANGKDLTIQSENSENRLPKNELIPGTEKAVELPTVTSVQLNPTGSSESGQLDSDWVSQALSHEQGDDDAFEKLKQEMYVYEDKTYHAKLAGCNPTDPVTATPVTENHSTGVDPTVVLDSQSSSNAQLTTVNTQATDPIESTEPASLIKSSPQPQLPDTAPENTPLTEEQLEEFQAAYDKLCVTFGDDFLDFLENPSTFTGGNIDTVPSPVDSHANVKNPPVQSENSENGLPKNELIPGTERAVELPTVTSEPNPTGNKSILQLGTIWVPQAPCQEQVDEDPLDKFFRMQELYEYEDRAYQSGAAPYTQVPGSDAGQASISPAAGREDDQNVTVSRKRPREPEVEDDIQSFKKIKLEAP